jgi:hypothetical protein
MATLSIRPQWYPASHAKWEAGQPIGEKPRRAYPPHRYERFAAGAYYLDRSYYDSFPNLQVLVVRIGRFVSRPSDVLSETDVPSSAEADLTEPFRVFEPSNAHSSQALESAW